jgi:F0F1-type ATP synthase membrane subunit a
VPAKSVIVIIIVSKTLTKEIIIHTRKIEPSIIFVRIFIFILINNLIGLVPYVFTASAHLTFSLALALTT